jgi:hypothetical protein
VGFDDGGHAFSAHTHQLKKRLYKKRSKPKQASTQNTISTACANCTTIAQTKTKTNPKKTAAETTGKKKMCLATTHNYKQKQQNTKPPKTHKTNGAECQLHTHVQISREATSVFNVNEAMTYGQGAFQ